LEASGAGCVFATVNELPITPPTPVLVIDSYRIRADTLGVRGHRAIVAIDDLLRNLAVEVVVDPCPGAVSSNHPAAGSVLAGCGFAPLPPSIVALRDSRAADQVDGLLVATGGADAAGFGYRIVDELRGVVGREVRIALAVGPHTPGARSVSADLVRRTDGLAPELLAADLVVTAGGVTLLEALCLGRPTVSLVLYDNQRRQVDGATRAGATVEATLATVAHTVASLIARPNERGRLADAAAALVDGLGSARIAEAIVGLA